MNDRALYVIGCICLVLVGGFIFGFQFWVIGQSERIPAVILITFFAAIVFAVCAWDESGWDEHGQRRGGQRR